MGSLWAQVLKTFCVVEHHAWRQPLRAYNVRAHAMGRCNAQQPTWLPRSEAKVPVGHALHADRPGASVKVPTGHAVQLTSLFLLKNMPGRQAWQTVAPVSRRVSRPVGQTVQTLGALNGRKVRRGLQAARAGDGRAGGQEMWACIRFEKGAGQVRNLKLPSPQSRHCRHALP